MCESGHCSVVSDSATPSLPGSSVHGILQAGVLEWVAIPLQGIFPTRKSNLQSCIAGTFFTIWATKKAHYLVYFK